MTTHPRPVYISRWSSSGKDEDDPAPQRPGLSKPSRIRSRHGQGWLSWSLLAVTHSVVSMPVPTGGRKFDTVHGRHPPSWWSLGHPPPSELGRLLIHTFFVIFSDSSSSSSPSSLPFCWCMSCAVSFLTFSFSLTLHREWCYTW